jgi:hypothetical protein
MICALTDYQQAYSKRQFSGRADAHENPESGMNESQLTFLGSELTFLSSELVISQF